MYGLEHSNQFFFYVIVIISLHSFSCLYIHLRFKDVVLGTHLSYLGCLSRTVCILLLGISEREGVVALHLPIGTLKTLYVGVSTVMRTQNLPTH